jgi:hypothetical protein
MADSDLPRPPTHAPLGGRVVADELGILARRPRAESLPASFVADANGQLVWSKSGYDAGTIAALFELLASLRAPR